MDIRFSRHAKNKLRLYGLVADDVKTTIEAGESMNMAGKWESRYGKLRVIWLMVGSYALVITIIRTR